MITSMKPIASKQRNTAQNTNSFSEHEVLNARWLIFLIIAAGLVVRSATGIHPYSGENTPPMFGDYEAQRHWMEVALHVPVRDWYRNTKENNLSHWGLDYPPLSGYASWFAGKFLSMVDGNATALISSHGYESPASRAAMRATVLLADILVFFPALALFTLSSVNPRVKTATFCTMLPCLILIDHGHFQYNSVSIGLFLMGINFYLRSYDVVGAVLFTLSLYFKQMGLYYGVAIFAFHLNRLVQRYRTQSFLCALSYAIRVNSAIILTTVATFWPWIRDVDLLANVIRRIFPISRGLYESKVGNFWCSISVIVKVQQILSREETISLCAATSLLAALPFVLAIAHNPTEKRLLLGTAGCSLAAYLFSYQVHEKQILIPAVPFALLFEWYPELSMWMSLAASASLFPLLLREGLALPYFVINAMHIVIFRALIPVDSEVSKQIKIHRPLLRIRTALYLLMRKFQGSLFLIGLTLHWTLMCLQPPQNAPDILELLLTSFSCAIFIMIYTLAAVEIWLAAS